MSDVVQSIYKIRHKVTGKFSKGGYYVSADGTYGWTDKGGKIWDTIGKLRSHITVHMDRYSGGTDMSEWEVLEYKLTAANVQGIHEVIDPKKIINLLKK